MSITDRIGDGYISQRMDNPRTLCVNADDKKKWDNITNFNFNNHFISGDLSIIRSKANLIDCIIVSLFKSYYNKVHVANNMYELINKCCPIEQNAQGANTIDHNEETLGKVFNLQSKIVTMKSRFFPKELELLAGSKPMHYGATEMPTLRMKSGIKVAIDQLGWATTIIKNAHSYLSGIIEDHAPTIQPLASRSLSRASFVSDGDDSVCDITDCLTSSRRATASTISGLSLREYNDSPSSMISTESIAVEPPQPVVPTKLELIERALTNIYTNVQPAMEKAVALAKADLDKLPSQIAAEIATHRKEIQRIPSLMESLSQRIETAEKAIYDAIAKASGNVVIAKRRYDNRVALTNPMKGRALQGTKQYVAKAKMEFEIVKSEEESRADAEISALKEEIKQYVKDIKQYQAIIKYHEASIPQAESLIKKGEMRLEEAAAKLSLLKRKIQVLLTEKQAIIDARA